MSAPSSTTQALVEQLLQRDQIGQRKYGTSLDRADLGPEEWAQHAIEEALDMAGYLARFAATLGELRAENLRLASENVRMRAMLQPILDLARTLESRPAETPQEVVQSPASPLPVVSEPIPREPEVPVTTGLTAHELAAALGCHKDSINNYKRAGLLPEPIAGTGGHPHNPARYLVDIEELRQRVEARREAAKAAMGMKTKPKSVPEPSFDVNENGRFEAIEHGRSFFRPDKAFDLWRICQPSSYQWRVVGKGQTEGVGLEGGEVVEHWQLNGLGQWESTPHLPGVVGTGNGVTKGAAGYKVPVLG